MELNRASDKGNAHSSHKTRTQCRDKWHNLLMAYKKAKDSATKSGERTKKMKAFEHFDQWIILWAINTKSQCRS